MAERFPHMLFKPGTAVKWRGQWLDTRVVADAAALERAQAEGWRTAEQLLEPASKVPGAPAARKRKRRA